MTSTDAAGSETGPDVMTFNVTRTGSTATTLAVNLTFGGTATAADYTVSVLGGSLSGSVLTLAAGSSSATLTVTPVDDTAVEGSETVILTIASGSGYTVGAPASQTGTIADNDTAALPSLSIQSTASVTEGDNQTRTVSLTVTLSAASTQTVTVAYATANGTATAGSDYVAKTGTLTFAPGVLTQTISVTINGDRTAEAQRDVHRHTVRTGERHDRERRVHGDHHQRRRRGPRGGLGRHRAVGRPDRRVVRHDRTYRRHG